MPGGRGAVPRRILQEIYGTSVRYGYRPGRVLWLLAVLLIGVIVSLDIPAGQATVRATDAAGDVYATTGLLHDAGGASAQNAAARNNAARGTAAEQPADACGDGQIRCFSPVLYAIDTVVPLVSLEQRSTWYPDPHQPDGAFMQWWLNLATLLGWLLSSIFVLSLARIARSSA